MKDPLHTTPGDGPQATGPLLVRVESTPAGASVRTGDTLVGKAPVSVPVPAGGEVVVRLELPGHVSERVVLRTDTPPMVRVTLKRRAASDLADPFAPKTDQDLADPFKQADR